MKRPHFAIAAAVLCLGIVGCSTTTPQSLTLVDTKAPAQLLRNDAGQRLVGEAVETVGAEGDYSSACKPLDEDPKGLYRAWRSTLLATVAANSASAVDEVVDDLVASFAESDWKSSEQKADFEGGNVTTMTRDDSIITLMFTAKPGDGGGQGTVYIEAIGPCVLTDGPASDEVLVLEQ